MKIAASLLPPIAAAAILLIGPYAASASSPYFLETFDGPKLNRALQDADSAFVLVDGVAEMATATTNSDRHYIRTTATNYISRDFVTGLTFSLTNPVADTSSGGVIHFFGIGSGVPDPGFYNEVTNCIEFRIQSMGIDAYDGSGRIDAVGTAGPFDFRGGGVDFFRITSDGGIHRAQISKKGNSVTFAFDADYDGTFVPDATYTIEDISTLGLSLDETNSRIFFGTSLSVDFFDDFGVSQLPRNKRNR